MPEVLTKTYSIGSLLLVTFVFGVFLAGLRNPSDEMVLCTTATLVASVMAAWCVCLRRGPHRQPWMVLFAISATLFELDLYLVPFSWKNGAFALLHPEDAAEHARSALSGFNKEAVAFGTIFDDGMVMLLAICTSAVISQVQPRRIYCSFICSWVAVASTCLLLVNEGLAFGLSVFNGIALTACWFVVVRKPQKSDFALMAFTSAVTCFMLFTYNRMLPELNLYTTLHSSPNSLGDVHQHRYIFQAIHRDCMALWFGSITAASIAVLSARNGSTYARSV